MFFQIALTGDNFCTAAKDAMDLLWSNAARASIIAGMGSAFMLVGKLTISFGCVFICYELFDNIDKYKTAMSSYNLSLFVKKYNQKILNF